MLTFALLLCLSQVRADVTYTFTLNGTNALGSGNQWQWTVPQFGYMLFPMEADQTQEFAIDLTGIKGARSGVMPVKLGDHTRVKVQLDYHHGISGFVECSSTDDDGYCSSADKCDPGLGVHKFKVFNQDVYRRVGIKIEFDGNDDGGCKAAKEFATALTIFLVTIGVCFCLCILGIILSCVGMINCCCMQKPQTRVIRLQPTNAGRQQQPGAPDLTPYNAGLEPGWEAMWDPKSQNVYWVNHNTQTNSWVDPRITSGV